MKAILVLCAALFLVSCTGTTGQAIQSLGVSEGENSFACLKGGANTNATVVNGAVQGVAIEMPSGIDISGWEAEQISALIDTLCGEV